MQIISEHGHFEALEAPWKQDESMFGEVWCQQGMSKKLLGTL